MKLCVILSNHRYSENGCDQGWAGDLCTVQAKGEVEIIGDQSSIDSTICSVMESMRAYFDSSVSVQGVKEAQFIGSSYDTCREMDLSQSNSQFESGDNGSRLSWWAIILVIISILLLLYTCCMMMSRRQSEFSTAYGEVTKNDSNEEDIQYPSKVSSVCQLHPTIDVRPCRSSLCESCTIEPMNGIVWTKTNEAV